MSLATRCTACHTVFRVVQDQLKVSEGWVRCGRCGAVFNALEGLFDLEPVVAPSPGGDEAAGGGTPAARADVAAYPQEPRDAAASDGVPAESPLETANASVEPDTAGTASATPPAPSDEPIAAQAALTSEPIAAEPDEPAERAEPAEPAEPRQEWPVEPPAPSPSPWPFASAPASTSPAPEPFVDAWPAPPEPAFVESLPESSARVPVHDATPASRVDEEDRIDFADARFNVALLQEEGIAAADSTLEPVVVNDDAPRAGAPTARPADDEPAPPAPEFLRQAERNERWTSPRARVGLGLASVMLLGLLGVQVALHYRDLVATLLPESRPALEALCDVAGCRIEPMRRIDDIVIDSSTLNALPGGDTVRLSLVLRNRGVFPLAMPAIELTLTDAGGQMIARRVLAPADFGIGAAAVLPAASEAPLQLLLTTSGRRASGYTVEPFYP